MENGSGRAAGSTPWHYIHPQINRTNGGERSIPCNPGLQLGEIKPQTSDLPMGVGAAAGETPSLTGEVVAETHRGLECAQAHLLGNQHQRGPV